MRIAVTANTAWYLSNFRLNLMRALKDEGHSLVAVASAAPDAEKIRAAGFQFEDVPISGSGTNPIVELLSVFRLWRLLRREKIDLVLSYTPKGNLYSALAAIAAGVAFVPDISGLGRAFIRKSWVTRVVVVLYRLTLGRATRVYFENDDDLQLFVQQRLVRPDRAERLPGAGIDLTRFAPCSYPERAADAPVFLLVARMLWDKGVGEYIEAARSVRARHPKARFQLLGFVDVANPSAISRQQVDAWVADGLVDYLGQTDDVRPWLEQADCVVLPSYREGLPQTLIEAAAMARIVVASDAPGCRNTVIDGETGFLCRTRDAADLADKLLRVLALSREQRQEMGQAGRAFVAANFDEKLVFGRYLALLSEIAPAPRPPRSPPPRHLG